MNRFVGMHPLWILISFLEPASPHPRDNILAEIPLPVMGIISELPMKALAQKLEGLNSAISRLGVSFKNPLLTLVTLTGAAIPYLRICEEGLVNLKDGRTLGLFAD